MLHEFQNQLGDRDVFPGGVGRQLAAVDAELTQEAFVLLLALSLP